MPKDIKCVFGVDIDAVGGWLGSYGGEDSPSDIQRGMFAGEVGTPRLLKLFKKYDMPATWFIPGHSIETFPDSVKRIVDAGHEIGAHGYSHENPIAMTPKQEEDVLAYSVELIEKVSGRAPRGLRAAVVGDVQQHPVSAAEVRIHLRPRPGLPRLHAVLRPGGLHLDEDRLL
jgi:peptidoglycan-N-acetylglucosamine deacetylase